MFDKMYVQNDILSTALQASVVRNDVIANNITNSDVPGYKAKTVSFENALQDALDRRSRTGELDLSDAKATVMYLHEDYNYRIDENNVDIESEMVKLYQNSIQYETMISGVQNNYKRLNLVLQGR